VTALRCIGAMTKGIVGSTSLMPVRLLNKLARMSKREKM
jgi:hypothetical protein